MHVAQPEAAAVDLDDVTVVQKSVEKDGGEHLVAGNHFRPVADRFVRGDDRRGVLVARAEDLEEQMGVSPVQGLEAVTVPGSYIR